MGGLSVQGGGVVTCAASHSLAERMAFPTATFAITTLFSNTSKFRDVQIFHNSHDVRLPAIPVGGRQMAVAMIVKASCKVVTWSKFGVTLRGAKSQTCLANGQSKKRWMAFSGSRQCGHRPETLIPRRCSSSPKGSAPLAIFHRNSFCFGDVFSRHTCFCHLKDVICGSGSCWLSLTSQSA